MTSSTSICYSGLNKRGDRMTGSKLQKNYIVTKQNTLNEFRPKDMTLQELRFFTIYLSKINPKDKTTRVVRFPLSDFQDIMELTTRIHTTYLKNVADGLLTKVTGIPDETGKGVIRFQLFKECRISTDENDEWFVEIDAHDRALPLMFDFKGHYFKYELWNALRLKSKNQLRMYEILKQYERIGYRIISVENLRGMLGIDEKEYPQYKDFKRRVLDVCQKALAEYTDISYEYEPHGKKGRGGKVLELKFTITKNQDYIDPLGLDKFINLNNKMPTESNYQEIDFYFDNANENENLRLTGTSLIYEERITRLMEACSNEFSREEIIVLFDIMPSWAKYDENDSSDFLQSKYREMDMRKPNKSRFGYLKKIINESEM